jgi:spore germination protein GerM
MLKSLFLLLLLPASAEAVKNDVQNKGEVLATLKFGNNDVEVLYKEAIIAKIKELYPAFSQLSKEDQDKSLQAYATNHFQQTLLKKVAKETADKQGFSKKYAKDYAQAKEAAEKAAVDNTNIKLFFLEIENSVTEQEIREMYDQRKQKLIRNWQIVYAGFDDVMAACNTITTLNQEKKDLNAVVKRGVTASLSEDEIAARFGSRMLSGIKNCAGGLCPLPFEGKDGKHYVVQVIKSSVIPYPKYEDMKNTLKGEIFQKKLLDFFKAMISADSIVFGPSFNTGLTDLNRFS